MTAKKEKSTTPCNNVALLRFKLINQSGSTVAHIFQYSGKYFKAELSVLSTTKELDRFLMSIDYPVPDTIRDLAPLLRHLRVNHKGYIREVSQTGWQNNYFLYGNEIVGKTKLLTYGDLKIGIEPNHKADINKFKLLHKNLFNTNKIPCLILGALFAAPLKSKLDTIRADNFGFLILGSGSDGKSTLLELMASFVGNYKNYRINSNTSRESLELTFAKFNDLPIFLDDFGNLKESRGKSLANLVKSFSQGQSKNYLTQTREQIQGQSYSSILVASSNSSISDIDGITKDDTHDVRFLNIYCNSKFKIFDNLVGHDTAENLTDSLQEQSFQTNPILKVFIEKLVTYADNESFWQKHSLKVKEINVKLISTNKADNKLSRAAIYFAQTIAAIDLANELIDLGINNHYDLISQVYTDWTGTFENERQNPKHKLRNFIFSSLGTKIIDEKSTTTDELWGFYDELNFYLSKQAIDICFRHENTRLMRDSLQYEYIQKKYKGLNSRFYCFKKDYF